MNGYNPNNPHPLSTMRAEMVWEGKYDEFGQKRSVDPARLSLPLQRIETIDEPLSRAQAQGFLFDSSSAHRDDFRNFLIWGDNKVVMSSLLNNFRGSIDLIYIDPPFDVGADFKVSLPIGDGSEQISKDHSIMEEVAFRDIWGRGPDSYSAFLYERFLLMKELLSEKGQIAVHCGVQVNHIVRMIMSEVFGPRNEIEEVIWSYGSPSGGRAKANKIIKAHEYIIFFAKSYGQHTYHKQYTPYSDKYVNEWFK